MKLPFADFSLVLSLISVGCQDFSESSYLWCFLLWSIVLRATMKWWWVFFTKLKKDHTGLTANICEFEKNGDTWSPVAVCESTKLRMFSGSYCDLSSQYWSWENIFFCAFRIRSFTSSWSISWCPPTAAWIRRLNIWSHWTVLSSVSVTSMMQCYWCSPQGWCNLSWLTINISPHSLPLRKNCQFTRNHSI